MSMKNSDDIIGDRTFDFAACGAMPQPNVPLCAVLTLCIGLVILFACVTLYT